MWFNPSGKLDGSVRTRRIFEYAWASLVVWSLKYVEYYFKLPDIWHRPSIITFNTKGRCPTTKAKRIVCFGWGRTSRTSKEPRLPIDWVSTGRNSCNCQTPFRRGAESSKSWGTSSRMPSVLLLKMLPLLVMMMIWWKGGFCCLCLSDFKGFIWVNLLLHCLLMLI